MQGGEGKVDIEGPEEVTFLGIKAKIGAKVVLEPTFAISLAQLKDRIQAGHIRITRTPFTCHACASEAKEVIGQ